MAESRQARAIAILPESYTDTTGTRSGGMGARQLTTPPEVPSRPANHSVTTRVSDWSSGDGYNGIPNGVSSSVQITVGQPYVGRESPRLPVSRPCPVQELQEKFV